MVHLADGDAELIFLIWIRSRRPCCPSGELTFEMMKLRELSHCDVEICIECSNGSMNQLFIAILNYTLRSSELEKKQTAVNWNHRDSDLSTCCLPNSWWLRPVRSILTKISNGSSRRSSSALRLRHQSHQCKNNLTLKWLYSDLHLLPEELRASSFADFLRPIVPIVVTLTIQP
jgi:hypothetical protein